MAPVCCNGRCNQGRACPLLRRVEPAERCEFEDSTPPDPTRTFHPAPELHRGAIYVIGWVVLMGFLAAVLFVAFAGADSIANAVVAGLPR